MNKEKIAKARWSHILPRGYVGQQSFVTSYELLRRISPRAEYCRYLDVGCGRGQFDLFLARLFPTLELIGIDVDNENVTAARIAARAQGLDTRVTFEQADFDDTSRLRGKQWDGIVSFDALQHSKDLAHLLLALVQAWSRNGPLVISMWTFADSLAARELAEAWGFAAVWPEKEIRAIASGLGVALSIRRSRMAFTRRVERSLSSLVSYKTELIRLYGQAAYEARYKLERRTHEAVSFGALSQLLIYSSSSQAAANHALHTDAPQAARR